MKHQIKLNYKLRYQLILRNNDSNFESHIKTFCQDKMPV